MRGRLLGVLGFAGGGLLEGRRGELGGYRWVRTHGPMAIVGTGPEQMGVATAHVHPETWARPRVEVCDS